MFSFFKKKPTPAPAEAPPAPRAGPARPRRSQSRRAGRLPVAGRATSRRRPPRRAPGWLDRLRQGLRKTGSSIAQVFTGTQVDDALYEELESALLMADAGVPATAVPAGRPEAARQGGQGHRAGSRQGAAGRRHRRSAAAAAAPLVVGEHTPTVIMVVGVNGAGKTTSIGKLTRHLAEAGQRCCWRRPTPSVPRRASSCRSGPTATASTSSARKAATRRP
jgi:fused signal recognition particle receptor